MNNYGRLTPTPSTRITNPNPTNLNPNPTRRLRLIALIAGILLIVAAIAGVPQAVKYAKRGRDNGGVRSTPTKAMKRACDLTRYPELCLETLRSFPGVEVAREMHEMAHISMNMTLMRFLQALSGTVEIGNWRMDTMSRSAYDDCLELLEHSVDLLSKSLSSLFSSLSVDQQSDTSAAIQGGIKEDVVTWLSGAMTNQDTCTDGFSTVGGNVKDEMSVRLRDLSELVSNCLAIYAAGGLDDFSSIPIQNRRLLNYEYENYEFPGWMTRPDRKLLGSPAQTIQADIVVAQDGSGNVKTITEAIHKAPENSPTRFIIHVKAGTYSEENLKVGRKKTNLWFLGDGIGKTVITGERSVVHDKITTFRTAAFAATGTGFVVRDITFTNEAGPGNHQAVALRIGADHAVVYRCEVKGYQDTLYVHSQRQFFRECSIHGTVDFIFGNAAVVFQNCTMWARKPMPQQKNTITAQNRKDPNQNTGISIHACQIRADSDLESAKSNYQTYLGRPWKIYSRVVYMESFLGDHIDPRGWLEWNATSPLDKLYYGEYSNIGPQSNTAQRAKWPGLHVKMGKAEAQKFTVAQFIYGQTWITPTGVGYQAGLSA